MSVQRKRPVWVWPVVGLIFVALVGVAWGVGQLMADADAASPVAKASASSPAVVAPAVEAPSKVNQAELAKYWADNYSAVSWYSLTEVPSWDGNVLTARTKLRPDADARSAAISICGALSGYFVLNGREFQSVRVLDGAGEVLVSRHTQSDQCLWRR